MKLYISCMQCLQENGYPNQSYQHVEISDNGLHSTTCDQGHQSFTVLQAQKFEVLFEIGIMAIIDGYPREAVTSFSASLERFYEFVIRVLFVKHGIHAEQMNSAWKLVANQSERQYGAFALVWTLSRGSPPDSIDNKRPVEEVKKGKLTWKEFRNSVVHKGKIPSSEEAKMYGCMVYNHINLLLSDLKRDCSEEIFKVLSERLASVHQNLKGEMAGKFVSTMKVPTVVDSLKNAEDHLDFYIALQATSENLRWQRRSNTLNQ